jgi:phytoene dehydrogenase-like protein
MHRCRTGKSELMEKHTLHVSIIGGGIGGLAAACALQRQGIQVTVFERNPELREIGAGCQLVKVESGYPTSTMEVQSSYPVSGSRSSALWISRR